MDVLVEDSCGDHDVKTFDPSLLTSHCGDDFLPHLFQWAKEVKLIPLATSRMWGGMTDEVEGGNVLRLFYAWLDCHEDEAFQATANL